jgi:nucleotide-binding universal stress UspA family protein
MKKSDIKKILVPIDFSDASDAALSEAAGLAVLFKAELVLLHVVEDRLYAASALDTVEVILPNFGAVKKEIGKKMSDLQKRINKKYEIKCTIHILNGHIHSEVKTLAKKKKINLIVMGTHGASGFKEYFIGSNAQRVVTISDVPVLTTPVKSKKMSFRNILLPIDNSVHSRAKVNIALIFADLFNSNIHLIGLPGTKEKSEVAKFNLKLKSVEKHIEDQGFSYSSKIVSGTNTAEAALSYATKNKCDLIVINTGHESKTTGMFMGMFSQQIVNHSNVPVLSFKHLDGAVSIDTPGFAL